MHVYSRYTYYLVLSIECVSPYHVLWKRIYIYIYNVTR